MRKCVKFIESHRFFFTAPKQAAPFVMRKKEEENGAASYEGYCIDLLNAIQ